MNILSLFDGISCGRVALDRAGIKVDTYYASEVDQYATQISAKNYPDIIRLGDVTGWKNWAIDWTSIDLILAGSPCQGFSYAGAQLAFDDPRSKLFFTFVDILNHTREHNPSVQFLLENVHMKQEFRDVISNILNTSPIDINSRLVSAQNRPRLYWSSWAYPMPQDKGIKLSDVVFDDAVMIGRTISRRLDENGTRHDYSDLPKQQRLELRTDDGSGTITTVAKDNTVLKNNFSIALSNLYHGFKEKQNRTHVEQSPTIRPQGGGGHIPSLLLSAKAIEYMDRPTRDGRTHWDYAHHSDIRNEKSATVVANFFKGVPYNVLKDNNCIRYLHPIEAERLQTLPDNYTECVSKTQRYKAIGNGWTVDVIAHILSYLPNTKE